MPDYTDFDKITETVIFPSEGGTGSGGGGVKFDHSLWQEARNGTSIWSTGTVHNGVGLGNISRVDNCHKLDLVIMDCTSEIHSNFLNLNLRIKFIKYTRNRILSSHFCPKANLLYMRIYLNIRLKVTLEHHIGA